MQDLTMSSVEEEYDGIDDDEEFESYEGERYVSQMRFLSGKNWKTTYEELNVSTKPPPPLPQNYESRDFRRLTQSDKKGHLSISVATTSARVGFKCRSVLVKLREIYLILIEVPHLKQKLKAINLMSLFDYKIGNSDNQVIVSMVEHWIGIGTGEPMVLDESYTEYDNALRIFPDMEFKDYEKGCISFAYLQTYLDHIRVNIKDPANTNTIFRAFMLLYFGASKQDVKYIGGLFQLIGYQCYEYCQIGHYILIDN
ncbi:hypothetical protein GIB67_034248, partial [Kingdonia uniflora]